MTERLRAKLKTLYPDHDDVYTRLTELLKPSTAKLALSERDAMLITYGDSFRRDGETPLQTLQAVLNRLQLPLNSVHILPFYPWSSDDGFSVIDYYQVDPALGDWSDIRRLSADYRLMFDAVFNHISAHSDWFKAFLRGEKPDYFVTLPPDTDVSSVTRPRTHPLLTPFQTANGIKHVWTTFSDDQIDLNAANPEVLLELVKVLLFYVEQGAQFIRLDAIAFLWKEVGTTSIHLPQTHLIIQLLRDVLDIVAPETILITETNVPHHENLSYFGDGTNEAQMVYQFTLPPLLLHTLHTGDATALTAWAKTIQRVSDRTTFFNFTASHDGIGLRPVQGILNDREVADLVERVKQHGGLVSYRNLPDGSQSPYELNITYFDAITDPAEPEYAVDRFMVSQAIMLAFVGVPGIYVHSLFGSRSDHEGVKQTGRSRSINRAKLDAGTLLRELNDPSSLRHAVFTRYKRLLEIRTTEPAFDPLGDQRVLELHPSVFALERTNKSSRVISLHNISANPVTITVPDITYVKNLFDDQTITNPVHLSPYQILWLKV